MIESNEAERSLLVRALRWECDGVVSLELEDPNGDDLPGWDPGAHIDVQLPAGLVRQYSLCGEPADRRRWKVAVLRDHASRGGSQAVHELVRVGSKLRCVGPRNKFALEPSPAYIFVAGGIGITPILPMLRLAHAQGSQCALLYGGRARTSMAFLPELAAYGGVEVLPQDEFGLLPLADRLRNPIPNTLVYGCGPGPMLDALQSAMSVWSECLHIERFTPVALSDAQRSTNHGFVVYAARSGVTVEVPPGVSIVSALNASGVKTETSCEEGICGTCETLVVEGEPDHRDSLLSPAERASGTTIMICVSRCHSDRLVLEI
jgi:ferredoxin-NADP reductase